MTRSRAYKKNDQAFVEQKNGAMVRRLVDYGRFDRIETAQVMTRLSMSRGTVQRLASDIAKASARRLPKEQVCAGSRLSHETSSGHRIRVVTPMTRGTKSQ